MLAKRELARREHPVAVSVIRCAAVGSTGLGRMDTLDPSLHSLRSPPLSLLSVKHRHQKVNIFFQRLFPFFIAFYSKLIHFITSITLAGFRCCELRFLHSSHPSQPPLHEIFPYRTAIRRCANMYRIQYIHIHNALYCIDKCCV